MENVLIQTETVNLSEEQFYHLCISNQDLRMERDEHQNIIIMAPTGSFTGNHNFSIALVIGNWNEKYNLGCCFDSSAGFTLSNKAVRAADIAWITNARWESVTNEDKERFAHICPDFVIEVRSKSDTLKQQKEKMQEWIANGCRLAWLVDIENKITHSYKPNREIIETPFNKTLSGEDVLPNFELNLSEVIK